MNETTGLRVNCPRCGRQSPWADNPSRPFCSERCRMVDLGSWVNEEYSIAGEQVAPSEDHPEE